MGKEKVHFVAPYANLLENEMSKFLFWFNNEQTIDPVLKAALAHFWFIIIHPFDDGNGRIARALSDMLLARSENSAQRFYSLSNQILIEKKVYYSILQKVQHSKGDITEWLEWFLNCMHRALNATQETMNRMLQKADFWDLHKETELNARQRLMINKLLDGPGILPGKNVRRVRTRQSRPLVPWLPLLARPAPRSARRPAAHLRPRGSAQGTRRSRTRRRRRGTELGSDSSGSHRGSRTPCRHLSRFDGVVGVPETATSFHLPTPFARAACQGPSTR